MRRRAVALGEEFRGKGVNIHLGPSVGALGRKPRGGRSEQKRSVRGIIANTSNQTGKASAQIPFSRHLVEP